MTKASQRSGFLFGALVLLGGLSMLLASCETNREAANAPSDKAGTETAAVRTLTPEPDAANWSAPQELGALRLLTPLFQGPLLDLQSPVNIVEYAPSGTAAFSNASLEGDLGFVNDNIYGKVWFPFWYVTREAEQIRKEPPVRVTLKQEAAASLFPGSNLQQPLSEQGPFYSLFSWGQWLALSVEWTSDAPYGPDTSLLLWVRRSDVERAEPIEAGLWSPAADVSTSGIRHITSSLLENGLPKARIEQVLGPASIVETSRGLNQTGEPLRLGETWRYERDEAHLTVTFSEEGLVEGWHWTVGLPEEALAAAIRERRYSTHYTYRGLPLAPSRQADWLWRNEGTLAHTFLEASTDEVLLIRGDDGGFSGMHYDASLYALDRATGTTLWRIDAGFGGIYARIDEQRQHVTVFTPYDPESRSYRYHLRHIRLQDGETIWEREYEQHPGREALRAAGARNIVILYQPPFEQRGHVLAVEASTGKPMWEHTYADAFEIWNESGQEPYVLLYRHHTLYALDTQTGEVRWKTDLDKPAAEQDRASRGFFFKPPRSPFAAVSDTMWAANGRQLLSIDLKQGRIQAAYPLKPNEAVYGMDDRYLFIVAALDKPELWSSSQFEIRWYDTQTNRVLWTRPGQAFGGAWAEGERVYTTIDGVPAALDLRTGDVIWKAAIAGYKGNPGNYAAMQAGLGDPLLFNVGDDLVHFSKQDGLMLGRMQDVLPGAYLEGRERLARNGLLNRDGDVLYLASGNGYFSALDLKQLEQ